MSNPIVIWLLTLLAVSLILYVAEVFIPSHGVLSILATGCMAIVVVLCFMLDRWLGTGVLVALAILGPIGLSLGVSVWQRTPVGRKMVLHSVAGEPQRPFVLVGSTGTALTELRPMGECEFGDSKLEARSELGRIIPAGQRVIAIALNDGVAVVRPIDASTAANNSSELPKEL
ncbi:MAG TPA: NfeD family protein [Tepidisphaeraceae bacterium]|jgi:membrane-bound serine protease (ClpP class)